MGSSDAKLFRPHGTKKDAVLAVNSTATPLDSLRRYVGEIYAASVFAREERLGTILISTEMILDPNKGLWLLTLSAKHEGTEAGEVWFRFGVASNSSDRLIAVLHEQLAQWLAARAAQVRLFLESVQDGPPGAHLSPHSLLRALHDWTALHALLLGHGRFALRANRPWRLALKTTNPVNTEGTWNSPRSMFTYSALLALEFVEGTVGLDDLPHPAHGRPDPAPEAGSAVEAPRLDTSHWIFTWEAPPGASIERAAYRALHERAHNLHTDLVAVQKKLEELRAALPTQGNDR